jgi:hypothetical protein
MTPGQIQMVRVLLTKAGIMKQKNDIAFSFSDGRSTHLADLTHPETVELVKYLRDLTGQQANPSDLMRRKILSAAHEMHWELPDGRIDIQRLNNWLVKYSAQKKRLDEFSHTELVQLVSQFENVLRDFLKGI